MVIYDDSSGNPWYASNKVYDSIITTIFDVTNGVLSVNTICPQ
jgi:hypothetical protein